jgi:hypothetical protein
MKNFNAQTLLELLQNAKFVKAIPKSKDHNFKDPIKLWDSQRDKDYSESVADIDLKYKSNGEVRSILHYTSFVIINPGSEDESKEDIEFYIYKYGYTYRMDGKLEKKD